VDNPFISIEKNIRGHFRLQFYGVILRLLLYIERMSTLGGESLEELSNRYPFLKRYQEEIERQLPIDLPLHRAIPWWDEQVSDWETEVAAHLPLRSLVDIENIGNLGRAAFLLAGLVEEDSRLGTLLAHLQKPLDFRRPTLELIGQILCDYDSGSERDSWEICRGLLQMGALEAANQESPRTEWVMRIPALLWDAARGSLEGNVTNWCRIRSGHEITPLDKLILPQEFLDQVSQVPLLFQKAKARLLVLRGTPGSDRDLVATAVVQDMGRQVIEIFTPQYRSGDFTEPVNADTNPLHSLGILCTLANAVPLFTFDLGPGETAALPELYAYDGPVIALLGTEGGLRGSLAEQALTLTLPNLDLELRSCQWRAAFGDSDVNDLEQIAARFLLPSRYIRQSAAMAVTRSGLEQRSIVGLEDVRLAARALNRQLLDSLAEHIEANGTWDQLVVGTGTLTKLNELEQRCRFRERLLQHLGLAFHGNANRGVRALFSGSSGTGKTLAARVLAAELGMDLYRVDLASVINKYIGETEKNLHRVLSRAEELDIILLLDEGDALLGNRTDVKSSNDRYANLETNYLLQRLENYQGIVLVTTNAAQNIDSAFQRRMDVVVNFVPPQADERWAIWQLHLPHNHLVNFNFLERLSAQCNLTGGQIRNAALLASLLALNEGNSAVRELHLEEAVRAEYRKAGAVCPLDEKNSASPPTHLEDFIRVLS
jgi:hypothetical protein